MSRITDIQNPHERTDFAELGASTAPFEELSARTHETPCLIAEGKFDAKCSCAMSNVCITNASKHKGKKHD